jgi:hypothetical protein
VIFLIIFDFYHPIQISSEGNFPWLHKKEDIISVWNVAERWGAMMIIISIAMMLYRPVQKANIIYE